MRLIGRREEQKLFADNLESSESRLVAVYGRRRIGKTFLIRQYFKGSFHFEITGLHNGSLKDQLTHFVQTLAAHGYKEAMFAKPASWMDAFRLLSFYIDRMSKRGKKILFFDELPWFDTPRSKFLMAFEHFWNAYCSKRNDILMIICGSSASWMIKKVIFNKGGLHNRISAKINLGPFTLSETKSFLLEKGIVWSEYDIAQFYMIAGGIPYYIDGIRKGESVAQCIDRMCFDPMGMLYNEFDVLYSSLFNNSSRHKRIIFSLSTNSRGLTRDELIEKSGMPSGGTLSTTLDELICSGFISISVPYGVRQNRVLYQIDDFFTTFYLKFIRGRSKAAMDNWTKIVRGQSWISWSGLAFERLCFAHKNELKGKLGLVAIECSFYSWRMTDKENGKQIDMLIDRADKITHLCEIKFSGAEFIIDKSCAQSLRSKVASFSQLNPKRSIFLTMITTFGVKRNEYYKEIVQNEVALIDLF